VEVVVEVVVVVPRVVVGVRAGASQRALRRARRDDAEEAPGVAGAAASEDAVSLAAGVVFSLVALSTSDPPRFSAIAALFSSSSSRFMSA